MSIRTKKASAASSPTYGFSDDTDTGVHSSAANTLDLVTGGTSRAQVTSAGILVDTIGEKTSNTGVTIDGLLIKDNALSAQKAAFEIKTDDYTLTAADSGKVIAMNATGTKTFTLPATVAGLRYTLVVYTAATSGNGHSISPNASDKIMESSITPADDKDLINTQATGKAGDSITLVGDGADGWYVIAKTGTWARQG